jgi:hypothetical protein
LANRGKFTALSQFVLTSSAGLSGAQFKVEDSLQCPEVQTNREGLMAVLCFPKKGSNQLVCGIHNVALVENQIPIDSNAPQLGRITCFVCEVSRAVVEEEKRSYARNSR